MRSIKNILLSRSLHLVLFSVFIVFAGILLHNRIVGIDLNQIDFSYGYLSAGVAILFAAKVFSAWIYVLVLGFLSHPPTGGQRRSVYASRYASLLGRYVPGRFAAPGSFVLALKSHGFSVPVAIAASMIPFLMNFTAGAILSIPLVFYSWNDLSTPFRIISPLFLILILTSFYPPFLKRVSGLIMSKMKKEPLKQLPPANTLLVAFLSLARYCLVALAVLMLARSIGPAGIHQLPEVAGSIAFSFIIGFLAFFAPAGIGVRESVLLLLLEPLWPAAALVVVLFRIVDIATDLLLGTWGFLVKGKGHGEEPLVKAPKG